MEYHQSPEIEQRLKIELPPSSDGVDKDLSSFHSGDTNPDAEEDEDCLTMVNYTMEDSSTIDMLENRRIRQYDRNETEDGLHSDTVYTVSGTTNMDDDGDGSTIEAPTSFPDLSYNKFQTPLRRASMTETTISSRVDLLTNTLHGDSPNTASMLKVNKKTTRGHGTGKSKRRSHSAMLSLTDSNSLISHNFARQTASRPTTSRHRRLEDDNAFSPSIDHDPIDHDGKPPPFPVPHPHPHHRVPIDRSAKPSDRIPMDSNGGAHYLKLIDALNPRRLSLSVSSMTSDASYSRSSMLRHHTNYGQKHPLRHRLYSQKSKTSHSRSTFTKQQQRTQSKYKQSTRSGGTRRTEGTTTVTGGTGGTIGRRGNIGMREMRSRPMNQSTSLLSHNGNTTNRPVAVPVAGGPSTSRHHQIYTHFLSPKQSNHSQHALQQRNHQLLHSHYRETRPIHRERLVESEDTVLSEPSTTMDHDRRVDRINRLDPGATSNGSASASSSSSSSSASSSSAITDSATSDYPQILIANGMNTMNGMNAMSASRQPLLRRLNLVDEDSTNYDNDGMDGMDGMNGIDERDGTPLMELQGRNTVNTAMTALTATSMTTLNTSVRSPGSRPHHELSQLTPLLDAFESHSNTMTSCNETTQTISARPHLHDDDLDESEDLEEATRNSTDSPRTECGNTEVSDSELTSTALTTTTIPLHVHDGRFDEAQLRQSIDDFFSVIDSAQTGAVNFDILKICLKLLGIDLSAYQLDLLLNELTQYKPSLPVSKEMMHRFLLLYDDNGNQNGNGMNPNGIGNGINGSGNGMNGNDPSFQHRPRHADRLQVTLIRTEIIVGLLSNLQTTFANQRNKQVNAGSATSSSSSFMVSSPSKSRSSSKSISTKSKSKSKSRSRSHRRSSHRFRQEQLQRTKGHELVGDHEVNDVPYIVSKSRTTHRSPQRTRFNSDGNLIGAQPSLSRSAESPLSAEPPPPTSSRKPPEIRRRPPSVSPPGQAHLTQSQSNTVIVRENGTITSPGGPGNSPNPNRGNHGHLVLAPTSSNLPPLPSTPLSHKRHRTPQHLAPSSRSGDSTVNADYNQWLLICFKNSIIDSLLELLHNEELRVFVFDSGLIAEHMAANDTVSAMQYLFECQFSFMSNGTAFLDLKGFAIAMTKCNIHFEAPDVAIPLIFDQLLVTHSSNTGSTTTHSHSHSHFITTDAFVGWMMGHVRVHLHCASSQKVSRVPFDRRIDTLFTVLRTIEQEDEQQSKVTINTKTGTMSQTTKSRKRKRKSKVLNPFEVQSMYTSSGGTGNGGSGVIQQQHVQQGQHGQSQQGQYKGDTLSRFMALTSPSGLPQRPKQYHQPTVMSLRNPSTVQRTTAVLRKCTRPSPSIRSVTTHSHRPQGSVATASRSNYTVHSTGKVPHRPYKKRSHQDVDNGNFSKY